jgi:three-Cys-motif partner protein
MTTRVKKKRKTEKKQKKTADPNQGYFFDEPPQYIDEDPSFRPFEYPVWTRNKARLVQRYLRYFVFITRHGTYIDGFAGPQEPEKLETWTAGLVFDSEPKWLRNFFLCELDDRKISTLKALEGRPCESRDDQARVVKILEGDFNEEVKNILSTGVITDKEATFCLLDQRTFECDWETVVRLAKHKSSNKIELFYFLGTGWLHRAFSGLKIATDERMNRWWGRDDWTVLKGSSRQSIAATVVHRFKHELGYKYANAFPIYEDEDGERNAMYQMIHASDHPDAPKLMIRAYRNAVNVEEPPAQLEMELGNQRA